MDYRFIPLLLGLTLVDYIAARLIERSQGSRRRLLLIGGVGCNLAMLAFFKYYNFAAATLLTMSPSFGDHTLSIILPLGISFHTFQSISYIVDVYRGDSPAISSVTNYALYISFFPQLIAGPIVRAQTFFLDLEHWRAPSQSEIKTGVLQIVAGLTKKLVFADQFAIIANAYFSAPIVPLGSIPGWSAVLAFAIQIYFDFSGYTDIAIGSARLFGFHFPPNFQHPYFASDIGEFWHRWHISLSSWLRDYVYIPLGGSRSGTFITFRNLFFTMVVGGLWHGANWTFLIWGAIHGLLLMGHRLVRLSRLKDLTPWPIGVLLTFFSTSIAWVFFRATSVSHAFGVLTALISPEAGASPFKTFHFVLLGVAFTYEVLDARSDFVFSTSNAGSIRYGITIAMFLLFFECFGAFDSAVPFVYFQF